MRIFTVMLNDSLFVFLKKAKGLTFYPKREKLNVLHLVIELTAEHIIFDSTN